MDDMDAVLLKLDAHTTDTQPGAADREEFDPAACDYVVKAEHFPCQAGVVTPYQRLGVC